MSSLKDFYHEFNHEKTQARPLNDCFEDLANAVVLVALKDYVIGDRLIQKGTTFDDSSSYNRLALKQFRSADNFLHSDRLQFYTSLNPDYLIRIAKETNFYERTGAY